jgi:cytoskeleton protein RodZ
LHTLDNLALLSCGNYSIRKDIYFQVNRSCVAEKLMIKSEKVNIIIGDTIMNEEEINNIFHSLKEKREALGLTLKDVFQRTRLTAVNLEAIENGNLHLLPVPIYTRNFIKTYARALGIDSKPFLASYESYLNSLKVVETKSLEEVPEDISYLDKIVEYKAYLWTAAVLIFIFIVSLLIFSTNQPASDNHSNQSGEMAAIDLGKKADPLSPIPSVPVPSAEQIKAITQPVANDATKTKTIPAQSNAVRQEIAAVAPATSVAQKILAVLENKEDGTLIIKATEETWLRIQTDQNPSYQVLLKAGEKIVRKAASVEMDIGNAGGITIQFKGKSIENIGKSGEVIHLRLP